MQWLVPEVPKIVQDRTTSEPATGSWTRIMNPYVKCVCKISFKFVFLRMEEFVAMSYEHS